MSGNKKRICVKCGKKKKPKDFNFYREICTSCHPRICCKCGKKTKLKDFNFYREICPKCHQCRICGKKTLPDQLTGLMECDKCYTEKIEARERSSGYRRNWHDDDFMS